MKTRLVAMMALIFTTSLMMANGGPSFKELYKTSHKDKPVVELIDQSAKKLRNKFV